MPAASKKPVPWKLFFVVTFVVALAAIFVSTFLALRLQNFYDPAFQKENAAKETQKIIEEVGELYLLPEGVPQMAIVSDPEVLKKGQPFFEKAIAGDNIIVYPDIAILYRRSEGRIINIGPVNSTQPIAGSQDQ